MKMLPQKIEEIKKKIAEDMELEAQLQRRLEQNPSEQLQQELAQQQAIVERSKQILKALWAMYQKTLN